MAAAGQPTGGCLCSVVPIRLLLSPPSTGRCAGDAVENAGHVALIGKTTLLGNGRDWCLGGHQQMLRPLHPLFQQPLMWRHPCALLKSAGEMTGGHTALSRQISNHMISRQIAHHRQSTAQLPRGQATTRRRGCGPFIGAELIANEMRHDRASMAGADGPILCCTTSQTRPGSCRLYNI